MGDYPVLSKRKAVLVLVACGILALTALVPAVWATPAQNPQRQSIPTLTLTPTVSGVTPETPRASPPPVDTPVPPTDTPSTGAASTAAPPATAEALLATPMVTGGSAGAVGQDGEQNQELPTVNPVLIETGPGGDGSTTPNAAFVPTKPPTATATETPAAPATATVSSSSSMAGGASLIDCIVVASGLLVMAVGLVLLWRRPHELEVDRGEGV